MLVTLDGREIVEELKPLLIGVTALAAVLISTDEAA
jgi:hypothetical protein